MAAKKGAAEESKSEKGEAAKKRGSPLVKIILLVVILGLLGGGGFFAYVKFFKAPSGAEAAKTPKEEKTVCELEPFLVNLADAGGKRYLKVNIKIEVNNAPVAAEFNSRLFEVRDAILMLLSSKEYNDISSAGGKITLKREIISQLNRLLRQGQVREVYFTEFIVQ
ncbi:MAG: flagellar basal body-associated FliL family protein [Syntrophobacteraceae bacterium]|nr:flagellar basal body-associated FliL family protein [Syntrophobacteraceae bacterium]